jgi:hypothetical protein
VGVVFLFFHPFHLLMCVGGGGGGGKKLTSLSSSYYCAWAWNNFLSVYL